MEIQEIIIMLIYEINAKEISNGKIYRKHFIYFYSHLFTKNTKQN